VAIVELYDGDEEAGDPRLVNISTRGYVGTGANVMIPGFVVSSGGSHRVLIRAVGPSLMSYGVAHTLGNPMLTLFRSNGNGTSTVVLVQDDWSNDQNAAAVALAAASVGAFPLDAGSADAATVVTLDPGAYTVMAEGVGGGTGVVLVELYDLP